MRLVLLWVSFEIMIDSYRAFWVKSFVFEGKTNRVDFWLAAAANVIILVIFLALIAILVALVGDSVAIAPIALVVIYSVATIVPNISIQVRRLRDAGFNPWLLLVSLIPYAGGLILFMMYLQPSKAVSPAD